MSIEIDPRLATHPRSASEEVAEQIRLHVESEALPPGHRLGREQDLASQFGVSRPTIREALRLLSSAHLVKASKGPGGGIFVANTAEGGLGLSVSALVETMISAQSISLEELLETRMLLEVPLVGLAAQRADPAQVEALKALVERDAGADDPDEELTAQIDAQLHRTIAETAGNRLLAAFTMWIGEVLQPRLFEVVRPAIVESVAVEQHRDIVAAIERNDPIAAERAMREHLSYLIDLLIAVERRDREAREERTERH